MLKPGEVVGNYTIESLVGEGGFATVWRMRHRVLTSDHALKVLRPELVSRRSLRNRFLNEARVMACLRHPNIVRATDTISAPGIAGIVMDFIVGGSLGAWMDHATATPSPSEVRDVFLPVLDAMAFAHRAGIVHRDIKPANIMLEMLPDRGVRPLVTDFGVARVRGEIQRAGEGQTATGTRMGTLGYMSPEQIRSAAEVDARSDIFSLAVTLFEFATLQRMFDRDSEFGIMQAIITGEYEIPADLWERDPRLAAALQRALALDPADRFPDCVSFAEALRLDAPAPAPRPVPTPPLVPPPPEPEPEPEPEPPPDVDVVVRIQRPERSGVPAPGVLGRLLRSEMPTPPSASLVYQPGTPEEREIPVFGERLTIGRAAANDIRLPRDAWVARYHCRLEYTDEGWVVRDNGTVNGTLVNGDLVLRHVLQRGDEITVGQTRFRFLLGAAQ